MRACELELAGAIMGAAKLNTRVWRTNGVRSASLRARIGSLENERTLKGEKASLTRRRNKENCEGMSKATMFQAVTRVLLPSKIKYAGVAELADAQDLGSCVNSCRFKSCHPHQKEIGGFVPPISF